MTVIAKMPLNEIQRQKALDDYKILDSEFDPAFDRITKLAADMFKAPICLVSLVDKNRQWFKSACGLDVRETGRDIAFCSHAILGDDIFYIRDTFQDDRFKNNPLVTDAPYIRTYCGAPLITRGNQRLGTLCLIYDTVTDLTESDFEKLETLAKVIVDEMDYRIAAIKLREQLSVSESQAKKLEEQTKTLTDYAAEQSTLRNEAEQAEKIKSTFLSNMSHEIRTPMTAILGMVDLLLEEDLNSQQNDKIITIKNQADVLLSILNDVLDQSSLETGNLSFNYEDVALKSIMQNITQLMTDRAASKRIDLAYNIAPSVPAIIHTEPTRFQQILLNLLGNAIKFSADGNIAIAAAATDNDMLRITVTDNGPGISDKDKRFLFQRFFKASKSLSKTDPSSGLGLSICANLVKVFKGEIGVESEIGNGSTFWFTIPLEAAKDQNSIDKIEANTKLQTANRPLRILLAEDNHINQMIVRKMMTTAGHSIDIVNNGQEALDACKEKNYQMILMDIRMPVMDGMHAARRMRCTPGLYDIPIIALTADATPMHIEEYYAAGIDRVCSKPFEIREIFKTINDIMGEEIHSL